MNSRISAGSTVVDCCHCQRTSPLHNVGQLETVKNRKQNSSALLTNKEPYQRSKAEPRGPKTQENQDTLGKPGALLRVGSSVVLNRAAARQKLSSAFFLTGDFAGWTPSLEGILAAYV